MRTIKHFVRLGYSTFMVTMAVINRSKQTNTIPSVIETDDGGAVPDRRKWYIAIVHTNCELKVKNYLEQMGVEAFVPVQTHVRLIRGRRREVEQVVLRARVFVRTLPDSASRTRVKKTLFVKSFVTYPGTYQDAVIPDRQMEQFKYMLGCPDAAVVVTTDIKIGQRVRVARGYFKGMEGNVCEVGSHKNTCIGVGMDILGYACVSIDITDLEFLE